MDAFVMEIAGAAIRVEPLFETTRIYCREYLTERAPEVTVAVCREDLAREQVLLDEEADAEGLKRRRFPEPFLERSVIQRRSAEYLIGKDVLLMHGSTVAVDGRAYLFTAPCGTGKSTHTRLWREVFGGRAVMVNDDKPFLRFMDGAVIACGTPWTGKHGLGSNVSAPLTGICILSRGAENGIRRADPEDVSEFLLQQLQPDGDPRTERLLRELLRRVPVWQMECNRELEAARIAYCAMSGKLE